MNDLKNIKTEYARKEDLEEILKLEQICFGGDSFSKSQFKYLLSKANGEFVVLKDKKKIIAYLIILKRKNSNQIKIYSIAIAPDLRGLGLAKRLLEYTEKFTKEENKRFIALEVKQTNYAAINLYLNFGFRKIGIKRNYYFDGEGAILMRKEL